jgi:hypothetical protein
MMTRAITIIAYTLAWAFGTVALLFIAATLGGSFIELQLWTPLESESWRAGIVFFAALLAPLGACHGSMKAEGA